MELEKLKTLLKPLRILDFAPRDEEELQVYLDVLKMKDLMEDVLRYAIIQILEKETIFPKPAKILQYYNKAFLEIFPEINFSCLNCMIFSKMNILKLQEIDFKCKNCGSPLQLDTDVKKVIEQSNALLSKIRT